METNNLRKAAEIALKALESYPLPFQASATSALRQALAESANSTMDFVEPKASSQPEQEPVAWMHNFIEGNVIAHKPADISRHPDRWTALYKDQTLKEKNGG